MIPELQNYEGELDTAEDIAYEQEDAFEAMLFEKVKWRPTTSVTITASAKPTSITPSPASTNTANYYTQSSFARGMESTDLPNPLAEIKKDSTDPGQGDKNAIANVVETDSTSSINYKNGKDPNQGQKKQEHQLIFQVPDWGYKDFIRERTYWQKSYDNLTGEPGYFYFKIFFRFDTNYGLFGGLLDGEDDNGHINSDTWQQYDTAYKYLYINKEHYPKLYIGDRLKALEKFGTILSYINGHAPWFFDSIGGLDKATVLDLKEPTKDREIEIGFREDAVDMRLTNLVDLYKYACFDYINMKEIVPENLRLFDMIIVLFHTPLRWYHTGMKTMKRGTFEYKSLNAKPTTSIVTTKNDDGTTKQDVTEGFPEDRMSYKMYTFKGCEFDVASMGAMYPSEMKNEAAFNMGAAKIKIKYKRVYQHTFNEWGRFMIGDDGVYYDDPGTKSKRLLAIRDAHDNPYYYNASADIFKPLVDASEARITSAIRQIQPSVLFGNLYGDKTRVDGDYYQDKLKSFKQGADWLHRDNPTY